MLEPLVALALGAFDRGRGWPRPANSVESAAVPAPSLEPHRAGEFCQLSRLEQRLDGAVFRAATRCWGAWRFGRAQSLRELPHDFHLTEIVGARNAAPTLLAEGLSHALQQGAFTSAVTLCEKLAPRLRELSPGVQQRARESVLEALILVGDRERASELAREHRASLRATVAGATLLELLDLGDAATWLPGGRANMLSLSKRIEAGLLDVETLAAELAGRPRTWLTTPELHLLFFNALSNNQPLRALVWLNRFLACHGLAALRLGHQQPVENLLAALEPARHEVAKAGPLVSVIVAARNAAKTLPYALGSLCAQTYASIEILACDDASDDATLELLCELRQRDSRVRVFRSSHNQGSYNVRNALVARARGELVTFHDADDFALPSRIAIQVARLRATRAIASIACWLRLTPAGRFVFFRDQRATRLGLVSLMLRKETFDRVGPFRSAYVGADLELLADLRARFGAHAISRIRMPLTLGLWSPSSVTRSAGTEALADGYRSPVRRDYSELVYAKHAPFVRASEDERAAKLRALGNFVEARDVVEVP
jgi:hypothetical protein